MLVHMKLSAIYLTDLNGKLKQAGVEYFRREIFRFAQALNLMHMVIDVFGEK